MHPNDDACVQSVPSRPCICVSSCHTERVNRLHHTTLCCLGAGSAIHTQLFVILSDSPSRAYCIHTAMPVCNLCYLGHASICPLSSCEAEQAAPSDALEPGSWQCTTHAEAVAQAFGANAPKRRCLCAICAKQAMHLRVLLPTECVNRLHHATLCCLGAGSAIHTQLYVILSDSPSWAYCIHTAMPVCNLCYLGHASKCPLASCEAEQAAPCDALVPGSWQCTTHAKAVAQALIRG